METIFVQIASFRDPECQWTIRDLFEKAAHPERIFVGVCAQYDPLEDAECFTFETRPEQVRMRAFDWRESRGVCWARHHAQQLWQAEDYVLSLDSHMRFEYGWDERLITQLVACPSEKAVLSSFPYGYKPPNRLNPGTTPSVVPASLFDKNGAMRARSVALTRVPSRPLRGAFVAPGFLFSRSSLISEIPYDPHLYFSQEELSLAVRLFTHGYDVYSPSESLVYHYYNHANIPGKQHLLHWTGCPQWRDFDSLAKRRLNHLVGQTLSNDANVIEELERYGLGEVRSLDEFEAFVGINFKERSVSEWALRGAFIEDLSLYLDGPIFVQHLDGHLASPMKTEGHPAEVLRSVNILMPHIPTPQARLETAVPPGVLLIHDYLSRELCQYITDYAATQDYKVGVVLDLEKNAKEGGRVGAIDKDRKATYIEINGIAAELINIFTDIYCNRIASFYDVDIEWFERPHLLRYPEGGHYIQHADCESWMKKKFLWERHQDRDYSVVLYLNDDFEGGQLEFTYQGYTVTPRPGMLLAFPSDHSFLHGVLPTTRGLRYAVVSWGSIIGSNRVEAQPPKRAVYMQQKRVLTRALDRVL